MEFYNNQNNKNSMNKKNILLNQRCDEKRKYLKGLFYILRNDNYNLIESDSEDKAYRLFEKNKNNLDAIITEVSLDNINSITLYSKMKSSKPDLKYFVSTKEIKENTISDSSHFYKTNNKCENDQILEIEEYSNLKKMVFDTIYHLEK